MVGIINKSPNPAVFGAIAAKDLLEGAGPEEVMVKLARVVEQTRHTN
jgi:hypothetical protein